MLAALAFFTKGVGRYITAAVLGFALCAGVYVAGYRASTKAHEVDRIKMERAAALRDLRAAEDAATNAERLMSEANRRSVEARKKAEDYAASLPASGGCALTGDDLNRLRNIRQR
ncbi:hypothetical protein LH464_04485 [Neorhizobium sp. T786]|uniref:hypothetical protein n=1 Tax=Pseudorhizobium xiangyangii TaxID=2883104 RepID=UPI001CFFBB3E|nr:hypothetical protein [Neorhizobium xiangyangii]MCB5201736.1 hypothetical protein [Neorhizobium xiangyangii]